ncbi:MAG TPA: hypothetical protein VFE61_22255 [Candidatus Sulfotelmatobacter sp.]|nr:hypothetical protein [Candidatus Sulfotelmatobacter sp.]
MWRGDGCNGISAELSPRERHASNVAALGLLFSIGARLAGQGSGGSSPEALLGLLIWFTLIVLLPTNKQLVNPALAGGQHQQVSLHAGERCMP